METPEKVKKGLECCLDSREDCGACPYNGEDCRSKERNRDALALIQQLEAKEPKWISVEEKLPEATMPPHDVLVYHNVGGSICIDRAWYSYDTHKWRSYLGNNLKVTHWMPLPEPPEEE